MKRSFVFAAALALALPGAALAQSSGGSGADVKANPTPSTAPKTMPKMGMMPKMGRSAMSHTHAAPSADHSADSLNAKELASIQTSQPSKP